MILSSDWTKIRVIDLATNETLATITPYGVDTSRDSIVVRLTPAGRKS